MKTISLCMVVRNEAKALPQLFKYIRPVIDEVIIFDQSSDDDTGRICKEFADTVGSGLVVRTVRKNLADIDRQDCYSLATSDYVLAMDADERPDRKMMKYLTETIKAGKGRHAIYWFFFRNLIDGVDIKQILGEDPHPRLWTRTDPPVIEWPTVAHTFPKFNSEDHLFCTRGKVDHIRTMNKVRKVQAERSLVMDDKNKQVEINFGSAVAQLIAQKKGRR